MLRNYFLTAWRNLLKTKGYSALNISGLAIGMAISLVIGLWVYDQYNYDRFLPNYQQLYQVRRNFNSNGQILNFTSTSLRLADELRTAIPEIEYVAESDGNRGHVLLVKDKKIYQYGLTIGKDFLKMFQYPLLKGNAASVLQDPYSIVLTQATAEALFGKEDPVGKMVRIDNKNNLKVTGVLKNIPYNSSFKFDYILPFSYDEIVEGYTKDSRSSYGNNSWSIYVRLKPGITNAQVSPKIKLIERTETNNTNAMLSEVILQPLANWHLYGNYVNGKDMGGFKDYVRLFTIIGVLVLLIACINFINLTTARSEKRAKEVGVRKAVGSLRKDLVIQFLSESLLLSFIAFLLSLGLVQSVLPAFNTLTESQIRMPWGNGLFWLITLTCVLITAVVAGSRPAFHLSSFNPVKALKGNKQAGKAATLPRKILVVTQFTCSIALIISTIVIYRQIEYARNRPTGYSLNRMLMTNLNEELKKNYIPLKNELLQKGIISSATLSSGPATDVWSHSDVMWPGKRAGETIEMGTIIVADDYFKTMGMDLKEGRDFAKQDTLTVIYNERAIAEMRLKQPVGQIVNWDTTRKIIGVTKNALMVSPFSPAEPTMFVYAPSYANNFMIYKLSASMSTQDAIAGLNQAFAKFNPSYPYKYSFADEQYANKFNLEVLVGKLSGIFAVLAVFICCLGLFGLAAYMAEQRTKEIGIRKVLGASVFQLWSLLCRDFIVLVFVSCLIASPLAFYFLQGWLLKYSYHISIGPGVFVLAMSMALLITIVTISFQAIRAALSNPTKSLKTE